MRFDESYQYPMGFDQVWAMYSDPQYTIARFSEAQLSDVQTDVQANADVIDIQAKAFVPRSLMPDAAKRFVPERVTVNITEHWERTGPDSAKGTTLIKVEGLPVSLKGASTLKSSGDGTARALIGELSVGIPFIGKRLEKQAVTYVPQIIKAELAAAQTWMESK